MTEAQGGLGVRARVASVLLVAAVGGAGTMIVELAAVRLLAPWFGSSLIVWTNVIAVVLLGLAVGYLVGARLSSGGRPLGRLGTALCIAALLCAWLPAWVGTSAQTFLPPELALHEAADVLAWGSLATSLLLFLLPAALLGTVSPLAVEAVQLLSGGHAGRAGGLVLFGGTLGSLVGVFGTSHVLLPTLGLAGTYRAAALALLLAGVGAFWLGRSTGQAGARAAGVSVLLALVGAGAAVPFGASRPAAIEGVRELAYAESAYQSVRVVEDSRWDPPLRFLQVNEGFDSYQSAWQPEPGFLPEGFYYNAFALPAWWSGMQGQRNALVLGLGAGTTLRVLTGASPADVDWTLVGVELDPVVVDMARRYLDLPPDSDEVRVWSGVDARASLRGMDQTFDLIVVDCYTNQVEIPPHLATLEFLREVRAALTPDGWLAINVGGFGFDDPVVAAVAETTAAAFEDDVMVVRVPGARNYTVFARPDGPLPIDDAGRLAALPPEAGAIWAGPLALPGAGRIVTQPTEAPLTDENAPVERLQMRSIAEGLAQRQARANAGAGS